MNKTQLPAPKGNYRWTICLLVFFATTINYLDRQVISLLKPILEDEFAWTESDYANIVIAFQFAYAVGMVIAGRIIDRLGTRIGYAIVLILWSIACILHGFVASTVGFLLVRAFLGITEAGNFPAAFKAVAEWFPKKERAFAGGIFNSGTNVGAILAPLTVPWIAYQYGWQAAFFITGAIGFIWLIFWFWKYQTPDKQKRLSKEEYDYIHQDKVEVVEEEEVKPVKIPWKTLLGYRQTWSFIAGKAMTDGVWWFFLFWLPAFLAAEYGLEGTAVGLPIAVVYILAGFASIFGGWLPMWLGRARGMPILKARKLVMLIYAVFPLLVIVSQAAGSINMWFAIGIIGISASAHQAWSANLFTTVSDMFPKRMVASVVGIGGMAGAIGSMFISKSAGLLFDHFKALGRIETGYYIMFIFCGTAYLIAWLLMFRVFTPNLEHIPVSD